MIKHVTKIYFLMNNLIETNEFVCVNSVPKKL